MRALPILGACLLAGVTVPATAGAMTLTTVTGRTANAAATQLNVVADPGEHNDLVVSQQSDASVVLRDPGATFHAQTSYCTIVSPSEARCAPTPDAGLIERVEVDLGDGDDRARTDHAFPAPTVRPVTPTGERLPVTFAGGTGNDDLHGGTLYGGAGDDALHGDGRFVSIAGDAGNDRIDGRSGSWNGGAGNDALIASGTRGGQFEGGPGDDLLVGASGSDALYGGGGRDVLRGGPGADTLNDGDERSLAFTPALGLMRRPVDADDLDGGEGNDTVDYGFRLRGVDVDLRRASGNGAPGENDRIADFENVTGTGGSDRLIGTDGPNHIRGVGSGATPEGDVIRGLGGDDDISAGDGAHVDAGRGDDTIQHFAGKRRATRPARVRCGSGRDVVIYPTPYLTTSATCEGLKLRRADTVVGPLLRADEAGTARGLAFSCGDARRRRSVVRGCDVRLRLHHTIRRTNRTWTSGGRVLGSSRAVIVREARSRALPVRLDATTRARLARARVLTVRVVVQQRHPSRSRRWSTTGSFVTTVRG